MVSEEEYTRHEWAEIALYILMILFGLAILPIFVGFSLRGFEDFFVPGKAFEFGSIITNWIVYVFFGIIAIFAIIFPISRLIFLKKGEHPATQTNPKWWTIFTVSLIHNPEEGALYTLGRWLGMSQRKNFMKWSISLIRFLTVGILIFGLIGILQIHFPRLQTIGIPNIAQQITPATQILFSVEPPSSAETGAMLFMFMLFMGITAYICSRFNLGIGGFFAIGFLIVSPLIGLSWMSIHNVIYEASSAKLFATFVFGWIGSSLTLLFGSWLFWYAWHQQNNLFAKMRELFPENADVLFFSWFIWGLLLITYLTIEYYAWKRRKKKAILDYQEPTFKIS
jgi:hypothetical protein